MRLCEACLVRLYPGSILILDKVVDELARERAIIAMKSCPRRIYPYIRTLGYTSSSTTPITTLYIFTFRHGHQTRLYAITPAEVGCGDRGPLAMSSPCSLRADLLQGRSAEPAGQPSSCLGQGPVQGMPIYIGTAPRLSSPRCRQARLPLPMPRSHGGHANRPSCGSGAHGNSRFRLPSHYRCRPSCCTSPARASRSSRSV